jgi:hypothetical protein
MTRDVILQGTGDMVCRIPGDTILESTVKRRYSLRAKPPVATRDGGFRRSRVASHLVTFLRDSIYVAVTVITARIPPIITCQIMRTISRDGGSLQHDFTTNSPSCPLKLAHQTTPVIAVPDNSDAISIASIRLPSTFTGICYALWRSASSRQW